MKNLTKTIALAALLAGALTACSDAETVSSNLSTDADNFKIQRRVVFFNGITDAYLLEIVGLCSIYQDGDQLEVTCKTGRGEYKKHFLGLSDNVTYFVEQVQSAKADPDHYKVTFKPQTIVPDIDFRAGGEDK